jgi:alpha-galactosidase
MSEEMKDYRITIIGGGSTTFVPPLIDLLMNSKPLQGSTLVLMDLDVQRLELMQSVCKKHVAEMGVDLKIESTTDRRKALSGADFVLVSIASGGSAMYEYDLEIPARYGIFTMGGETVGPGGLLHACRHIPILVDICREIEAVAPDAWLFNYTNPDTCVLMALERLSKLKKVSLCTCSSIPRRADQLAREIGLSPDDLVMPALAGGLNHCAAVLELKLKDGRDAFPVALPHVKKPILIHFMERYHVIPYGAGHWTEFFLEHTRLAEPYTGRVQGLKLKYGRHVRDMAEHNKRIEEWEATVRRYLEGDSEAEPVFLSPLTAGEGIEVVNVIESLIDNRNELHAVVTRNRGAIPNLPFNAVVEISSVVSGYGIHPVHVEPLPESIAANLRLHIDVFELVVEAALTGDRKVALDALLLDPQTSAVLTPSETGKMLDEMLAAEAEFLPQFFNRWRP